MNTILIRSFSSGIALIVTAGLFGVMINLIHQPLTVVSPPTLKLPTVVADIKKAPPPIETEEEVKEQEPPPITDLTWVTDTVLPTTPIIVTPVKKPVIDDIASLPREGDPIALVKVAATYPASAIRRGLEGFCTVEYVVTAAGTTRDVTVVEDMCSSSLFWKQSIKAAQKFKYQPQMVNGTAVPTFGVRNQFTFKLE